MSPSELMRTETKLKLRGEKSVSKSPEEKPVKPRATHPDKPTGKGHSYSFCLFNTGTRPRDYTRPELHPDLSLIETLRLLK